MGGKVTTAIFPPDRRVWTGRAVPPGSKFRGAITSIALLHDLMANTTVKGTAFVDHKDAIHTGLYSCTVHGNHPLSRGITVVRMHAKTYYLSSNLLCVNNLLISEASLTVLCTGMKKAIKKAGRNHLNGF